MALSIEQTTVTKPEESNLISTIGLELSGSEIEYVGIINKNGRLEGSIGEKGLHLTNQQSEMFFMQKRLELSMESDFDDQFGNVSYTITERENSKVVSIPIFSHIIVAIINKSADHMTIIKKIRSILKRNSLNKPAKEKNT